MHRIVNGLLVFGLLGLAAAGCTGSPVGDPCVPESIPPDGFDPREIYLETSSVQCRTRVCMVYQLNGDPTTVLDTETCPNPTEMNCVTPEELDSQVFCSCRCSVGEGGQANTPLCNCGDGYTCIDDVVTTGGEGVRGGYCVPCRKPEDDRGLDPAIFDECPVE